MAKKVTWSKEAINEIKSIFEYWDNKNGNIEYSSKLLKQFSKISNTISDFPYSGKQTDVVDIRVFVNSNFSIYYKIYPERILIAHIWDNRRNPEELMI